MGNWLIENNEEEYMNPQDQENSQQLNQITDPDPIANPKKRNTKKVVLTIVGVFVLLVAAGGIIAYMTTGKTTQTANGFVSAIASKDFEVAYSYFSPSLKQSQSLEAFQQALGPAPFDESCKLEVSSRESNASTDSGVTKKLSGDIKCNDASYPTELEFVDTGEGERISSYSIQPAQ